VSYDQRQAPLLDRGRLVLVKLAFMVTSKTTASPKRVRRFFFPDAIELLFERPLYALVARAFISTGRFFALQQIEPRTVRSKRRTTPKFPWHDHSLFIAD
jgi:hypothetical protein